MTHNEEIRAAVKNYPDEVRKQLKAKGYPRLKVYYKSNSQKPQETK